MPLGIGQTEIARICTFSVWPVLKVTNLFWKLFWNEKVQIYISIFLEHHYQVRKKDIFFFSTSWFSKVICPWPAINFSIFFSLKKPNSLKYKLVLGLGKQLNLVLTFELSPPQLSTSLEHTDTGYHMVSFRGVKEFKCTIWRMKWPEKSFYWCGCIPLLVLLFHLSMFQFF